MEKGPENSTPPPTTIVNADGTAPFVLVCEHASNYLPTRYRGLGLPEHELSRHIAWDIGAAELTRHLATRLDAIAFLAGASRLLVDCNRPLDSPTLIPEISEIPIPGNRNIDDAERQDRIRTWFEPLHAAIAHCLDERTTRRQPTAVIGVHSFTPVLGGVYLPMHAGILFGASSAFGRAVLSDLRQETHLTLAENAPYKIDNDDWTIPHHADSRCLPGLLLEIRHDGLESTGDVGWWADSVSRALSEAWRAIAPG
jgi:predicted N-formylglutamate amidohydrolase